MNCAASSRSRRKWSKCNVPSELWTEIFSYLPAKSLIRFRLVSKTWKSMIDDPDLASVHLKRFPNNVSESRLVVNETNCRGKVRWSVRRSDSFRKTLELEFPVLPNNPDEYWTVVGAVDGLFQLHWNLDLRRQGPIMLWNPSIRKILILPDPPSHPLIGGLKEVSAFDLSLGFDPSTNDYKVLLTVYANIRQPILPSSVEIFSLKERFLEEARGLWGSYFFV